MSLPNLKTISALVAGAILVTGCYTYKDSVTAEPVKNEATRTLVSETYVTNLVQSPTSSDPTATVEVTKVSTYSYQTTVETQEIMEKSSGTKAGGWASAVVGAIMFTTNKVNDGRDEGDEFYEKDGPVPGIMNGVGIGGMVGGVVLIALPKEKTKTTTAPGDAIEEQESIVVPNATVEITTYNNETKTFTTDANGQISFDVTADFTHDGLEYGTDIPLKMVMDGTDLNTELALNSGDWLEAPEVADVTYRGGGDPMKGLNISGANKEMIIGNYYALIIGIDSYTGEWNALNNAVNDAKAIEELLDEKYRFDEFITLYDGEATRANIIKALEDLVAKVQPEDNVFIYYSGHGQFKESLNKGYWVPVDATANSTAQFISNSDLQTFIGGINSNHTLLVSDACFSGDIFRGNTISVPFEESEKYYTEVHNLVSRQAISSGGIEPVMDGGKDGHSVFAYYFLKALRGNDAKFYDASQVYDSIKIPVTNNSEQSPQFQAVKNSGDEGGQFIFISKDE